MGCHNQFRGGPFHPDDSFHCVPPGPLPKRCHLSCPVITWRGFFGPGWRVPPDSMPAQPIAYRGRCSFIFKNSSDSSLFCALFLGGLNCSLTVRVTARSQLSTSSACFKLLKAYHQSAVFQDALEFDVRTGDHVNAMSSPTLRAAAAPASVAALTAPTSPRTSTVT